MRFVISVTAIGLFAVMSRPALAYIDNINGAAVPASQINYQGIDGIGWYYSPTFSYYLTGVNSYFNPLFSGPTKTVTLEIQTERPTIGGSLLRQGTFTASNAGGNLGASFAPLLLEVGHTYFVDYTGTDQIGINLGTWEYDSSNNPQPSGGATTNLGIWYTNSNNGFANVQTQPYGFATNNSHVSGSEPILRFDGFTVPEPSSIIILGIGGWILLFRRRRTQ